MKLIDIINANHWLSVELTLVHLYPDQEEMLDEYRSVYEILKNTEPENNNMRIVLTEYDSDPDDESELKTYIDVSGEDNTKNESGQIISYAIEFVEWKRWLGMDITPETLINFTELEIIAHCLYEMTFIGFDEDEIKEQLESLDNTIEEYKNLTEEEKKQRTFSFDQADLDFGI